MKSRGFPPVVGTDPRVLVLGSLPGRASLEAGEYYAQPRNAFWSIMESLCGAHRDDAYDQRLNALTNAGVALWDVLLEADRPGSLDASIVVATQRVNAVAEFIAHHASLELIAFNGKKSAEVYRRSIAAEVSRTGLQSVVLPSTSPAFASLRWQQKLEIWRRALEPHLTT